MNILEQVIIIYSLLGHGITVPVARLYGSISYTVPPPSGEDHDYDNDDNDDGNDDHEDDDDDNNDDDGYDNDDGDAFHSFSLLQTVTSSLRAAWPLPATSTVATVPQYGRLNDTRGHGWCPKTMEEASYLQIDLGTRREVCAVVTEEGRYPI